MADSINYGGGTYLTQGFQQGDPAPNTVSPYEDIINGYKQRMAATSKGYQDLSNQVQGLLKGYGQSEANVLAANYAGQVGLAQQGLAARGLGNTTIQNEVNTGLNQSNNYANTNLQGQLAKMRADELAGIGQAGLGFQADSSKFLGTLGAQGADFDQQKAQYYTSLAQQRYLAERANAVDVMKLQPQFAGISQQGLAAGQAAAVAMRGQNQQSQAASDQLNSQAQNAAAQRAEQSRQFDRLYGTGGGGRTPNQLGSPVQRPGSGGPQSYSMDANGNMVRDTVYNGGGATPTWYGGQGAITGAGMGAVAGAGAVGSAMFPTGMGSLLDATGGMIMGGPGNYYDPGGGGWGSGGGGEWGSGQAGYWPPYLNPSSPDNPYGAFGPDGGGYPVPGSGGYGDWSGGGGGDY